MIGDWIIGCSKIGVLARVVFWLTCLVCSIVFLFVVSWEVVGLGINLTLWTSPFSLSSLFSALVVYIYQQGVEAPLWRLNVKGWYVCMLGASLLGSLHWLNVCLLRYTFHFRVYKKFLLFGLCDIHWYLEWKICSIYNAAWLVQHVVHIWHECPRLFAALGLRKLELLFLVRHLRLLKLYSPSRAVYADSFWLLRDMR